MHSLIAAIANHHRSSANPIGNALANGPRSRLRFHLFEPAAAIQSKVAPTALFSGPTLVGSSSLSQTNRDRVVRVVSIVFAKRELHAGTAHPERHDWRIDGADGRLQELPVKPLGVPRKASPFSADPSRPSAQAL